MDRTFSVPNFFSGEIVGGFVESAQSCLPSESCDIGVSKLSGFSVVFKLSSIQSVGSQILANDGVIAANILL